MQSTIPVLQSYQNHRRRGQTGRSGYRGLFLLAALLLAASIANAQEASAVELQPADDKGISAGFLAPPPAEAALLDHSFFATRPALARGLLIGVSAGGAALGLGGVQHMLSALSNAVPVFGTAPDSGQQADSLRSEVHTGLLYTITGLSLTAAALLCYSLLE